MRALLLGCSLLLASACVPTFDDNLPLVLQSTLLAVQAEPAEAAPGEQVTFTGLVGTSDPNGTAPDLAWGLCIARKPLTELGPVNPVCIQAPSLAPKAIVDLGSAPSVTGMLPADACRLFGPSLPEAMDGQPPGRPVDPDPTGGFYQPVGVTLSDTGITSLGAVRIFCPPSGLDQEQGVAFNNKYRRNERPTLDAVGVLSDAGSLQPFPEEPEALSVSPGQVLRFGASWATCPGDAQECGDGICGPGETRNDCAEDCTTPHGCTGAENYAWFNPDSRVLETRHESLRVSWFGTGGRFANAVTGRDENELATNTENGWTAPTTTGEVRVWVVTRDARGGQSFRSFLINVQ